MTTSEAVRGFAVRGRVFLLQTRAASWSRVPLACPVCDERTGLTLIPPGTDTDPVRYACPVGHTSTDWRLTPDAQVQLVGDDAEILVMAHGGNLSSRQYDDGDGSDDFRDLPL